MSVESDIKKMKARLKRRVRICGAFIVAMLITGSVALARAAGTTNDGIATGGETIDVNNGIAIGSNISGTNNGISVVGGETSMGGTSTNHTGSGYSGYTHNSGDIYNVNVNDKNTTFIGEVLDPINNKKKNYTIVEASSYSNNGQLDNSGTINILENIDNLSSEEIFVGMKVGASTQLYNREGSFFNVASLNGADVIGVYYSDNAYDHNYGSVNISTEGQGTAYYFSQGGELDNKGTITGDIGVVMVSNANENEFFNRGTVNADTAVIMRSGTGWNIIENVGTINGDIVMRSGNLNAIIPEYDSTINGDVSMHSAHQNLVLYYGGGTMNGDTTFSGGGENYVYSLGMDITGDGSINGDKEGYNSLQIIDTYALGKSYQEEDEGPRRYEIKKNIYNFNVMNVVAGEGVVLSEGYEVSMDPPENYTPYSGMKIKESEDEEEWEVFPVPDDVPATELTIDGTLTLNTKLSGNQISVPKIETHGGDIVISKKGKLKFYITGEGSESSYDVVFGDNLSYLNVVSDGRLVAADGNLEDGDELFVETLGWEVAEISEDDSQTVVTLNEKDVYEEIREELNNKDNGGKSQGRNEKIVDIIDDKQNELGIHEALSNVSMDDAEKAVRELSGDMHGVLNDNHINIQKTFARRIDSMMSYPLVLGQKREDDFVALLKNATAELTSDIGVFHPAHGTLAGEGEYIQHLDFLGAMGKSDKEGVEYDTDGYGFIGITEKIRGENTTLGLSYGYFNTQNDYDDGSDSETKTFHLGLLHRLYFGEEYMLVSHLGGEYSRNDVDRRITTLDMEAESDYDSYSVGIGTKLSKTIRLNERLAFLPSVGVSYTRIERESFTESGSIGDAGLKVEKHELDSFTTTLGAMLNVALTDKLTWSLGGSWEHEYGDLNEDQEASFKGDVDGELFKLQGAKVDEDSYTAFTGLVYNVNDSLAYRVFYSFTKQDELEENKVDLGASWKF